MSVAGAYRQVRPTGCVYGTPERLKAQLADIAASLGTTDPIELGSALLLEQAGCERTQVQLQLDVIDESPPTSGAERREMEECLESPAEVTLQGADGREPGRPAHAPPVRGSTSPLRQRPTSPAIADRGAVLERGDNECRRDRAAQAIAAYDERDPDPGARSARVADPEEGAEAISELLCDLHHLADELDLDWARLSECAERSYAEEATRYVVDVTAEGFQVLDTWTEVLRADVWSSREQAQSACDELNAPEEDLARAA